MADWPGPSEGGSVIVIVIIIIIVVVVVVVVVVVLLLLLLILNNNTIPWEMLLFPSPCDLAGGRANLQPMASAANRSQQAQQPRKATVNIYIYTDWPWNTRRS